MIPADMFHDNGDGTAWWIPRDDEFGSDVLIDAIRDDMRPCDACDGSGWTDAVRIVGRVPCRACDNTGRHTFAIEVAQSSFWSKDEQIKYRIDPCDDADCCQRPPAAFRVSVVPGMVLPIVGDGFVVDGPYIELVDGGEVVLWTPDQAIGDHRSSFVGDGIMTGARPGDTAVQLRIATPVGDDR